MRALPVDRSNDPEREHDWQRALIASAERTVAAEAEALAALGESLAGELGDGLAHAVEAIIAARGRVVVSGMGKSGLIGRKIAATLASTGTPAFFLHPAEASHGDLGMIAPDDLVLVLSSSGETDELTNLLHYCTRFGVGIVAVTASAESTLAKLASIALVVPTVREACPNGLAPTSSSTVQAVLGDALAVALLERRGFSAGDFRRFHPAGRLAARLLTLGDLMSVGDEVPRVGKAASILEAAVEMSNKRFGVTAVVGDAGELVGAFTDGDLRRSLTTTGAAACVGDQMSHHPLRAGETDLASEALALMNARSISQLFVDRDGKLVGIVHLHDIIRAGVM